MINRRWIFVFMIFLIFLCINIPTSNADDRKGQKEIIDQIEANMVLIPAGEFLMGGQNAADESPRHKIYLDAFYIGKYEATFGEYEIFCTETGREMVVVNYERGFALPEIMLGKNRPAGF